MDLALILLLGIVTSPLGCMAGPAAEEQEALHFSQTASNQQLPWHPTAGLTASQSAASSHPPTFQRRMRYCSPGAAVGPGGKGLNCSFLSFKEMQQQVVALSHLSNSTAKHSWSVEWGDLVDTTDATRFGRSTTSGPLLQSLMGCINRNHEEDWGLSWEDITVGRQISNLKAVAGWWHSEQDPTMQVTLVTFGDTARMPQMRAQCMSWPGPMSVVIYQPLFQAELDMLDDKNRAALRTAVLRVMQLALELERQPAACKLNLLLVYEVLKDEATVPIYPLNSLRNLARLQARTPMVLMLDADLLPSRGLYKRLAKPEESQHLYQQVSTAKRVFILPAFELAPTFDTVMWADALAAAAHKDMMKMFIDIPAVLQFHVRHYAVGHRMTDYARWYNATEDYLVKYETSAEPWLLGNRLNMPWNDARYRGWGFDKVQFVNHLHHAGFEFMVLHDAYAVHRPHALAAAQHVYKDAPKPGAIPLHVYVKGLYREQLSSGVGWQPVVGHVLQHCMAALPWWSKTSAPQGLAASPPIMGWQWQQQGGEVGPWTTPSIISGAAPGQVATD